MNPLIQKVLIYSGGLVGIAVFSEVFWQLFCKYYEYIKNDEINEVIFTHDSVRSNPALKKPKKSDQAPTSNESYVPAILARIVELIDASKESIHACMYIFTVNAISAALLRAHKRGVKVRAVGDETMSHASGTELTRLDKEGLPIRIWSVNGHAYLMHHKFCLIDANWEKFELQCPKKTKQYDLVKIPKSGVLITGSANWTMQALTGNCENIIITSNRTLVERHQVEFQRIWKECASKFAIAPLQPAAEALVEQ